MTPSEVALHVAQNVKDMYQVRARYCENAYFDSYEFTKITITQELFMYKFNSNFMLHYRKNALSWYDQDNFALLEKLHVKGHNDR